jgi:hypothetical protein
MRDRLRALGLKARHDSQSLSLKDLDDICTLVAALAPTHFILPEAHSASADSSFEPVTPDTPHLEVQALLRQAHAMEYIALQLGELVKLKEEEVVRERWKAVPFVKDRSS